jgi:hypothetical protein
MILTASVLNLPATLRSAMSRGEIAEIIACIFLKRDQPDDAVHN